MYWFILVSFLRWPTYNTWNVGLYKKITHDILYSQLDAQQCLYELILRSIGYNDTMNIYSKQLFNSLDRIVEGSRRRVSPKEEMRRQSCLHKANHRSMREGLELCKGWSRAPYCVLYVTYRHHRTLANTTRSIVGPGVLRKLYCKEFFHNGGNNATTFNVQDIYIYEIW